MPKFKNAIMKLDTRVAGIPCTIAVTYIEPYDSGCYSGPSDHWRPAEGGWADYRLLDRKGYVAEWLERKIDSKIEEDLQDEIYQECCREQEKYSSDLEEDYHDDIYY